MRGMKFLMAAIEYLDMWEKCDNVMKDFYWERYKYNMKIWREVN